LTSREKKSHIKKMKQYIFSSAILLILDILWISIYMKNKYIKQIRKIQNYDMKINIIAGLLSYTLMILGLCVFVIPKISSEKHLQDSLIYGGLFGLIVYGIFDFTNMAVLEKWDTRLALIDIAWGSFVYSISGFIGTLIE